MDQLSLSGPIWNDNLGNSINKSKVRCFGPDFANKAFLDRPLNLANRYLVRSVLFQKQIFLVGPVTGQLIGQEKWPLGHLTDWSESIVHGSLDRKNGKNSPNSWTKIVAVSILSCFLFLACSDKIFSIFWISLIFKISLNFKISLVSKIWTF